MASRLLIAGTLALLLSSAAESGQPPCGSRDALQKHLERAFGEHLAYAALVGNGALMEVYMSARGETWTITMTADGRSACIVATGVDWQSTAPKGRDV